RSVYPEGHRDASPRLPSVQRIGSAGQGCPPAAPLSSESVPLTIKEEPMVTKLKKLPPDLVVDDAKQSILREFRQIPGVGKSIAEDLWNLGLRSVSDLKNKDPEDLYLRLCAIQRTYVERYMLYVFRF